jgi:hypothetical protein
MTIAVDRAIRESFHAINRGAAAVVRTEIGPNFRDVSRVVKRVEVAHIADGRAAAFLPDRLAEDMRHLESRGQPALLVEHRLKCGVMGKRRAASSALVSAVGVMGAE